MEDLEVFKNTKPNWENQSIKINEINDMINSINIGYRKYEITDIINSINIGNRNYDIRTKKRCKIRIQ